MKFLYQTDSTYFGAIGSGLEDIGAAELKALGADIRQTDHRGVEFRAATPVLYRIHNETRLFSRLLAPLIRFRCRHGDDLYDAAREIPWERFLDNHETFAVRANLHQSGIRNSAFAGMRTKDALVDRLRERTGARPSVDRRDPDLRIDVHVREENGTISIDTSGDSLHRRGYRTDTVQAPIQETLAAAVLEIAEWNGERPLIDPMCGSGTFLAEGLMRATKTPAGFFRRHFGLFHLPDFESDLWNDTLDEAEAQIREPEVGIQGSDLDKRVVASARRNLGHLPHGRTVRIFRSDFRDHPPIQDALVVCNPPYGVRLKAGEDLSGFYRDFGDFLKQKCTGCSAFVYFGERAWLKSIGLRPEWKRPLMNGGLDGRLARFELY